MLFDIILGLVLGVAVSLLGYYLVARAYYEMEETKNKEATKKIANRYFIRYFLNIALLFLLFKFTNPTTLIAATFGITFVKYFALIKLNKGTKGVN